MPTAARRSLVFAIAAVVVLALAGTEALGGLPLGGSAPALRPAGNLGVSVPSVSTPSLPRTSTPSAPSVSAPSAPPLPSSGSAPSVGGTVDRLAGSAGAVSGQLGGSPGLVPRAAAASYASALAAGQDPSSAGDTGAGGRAAGSHSGRADGDSHSGPPERSTVAPAYRGRAGERRLRRDVKRLASCLGALPSLEHRMLALRAGIGTAALSRAGAASRLHISRGRAIAVERRGIEDLKSAAAVGGCSTEAGPATLAARGNLIASALAAVPQLQPTIMLASRPSLTTTLALAGSRPRALSGVEAARASGGASALASGPAKLAGTQPSTANPAYFGLLLLVALLIGAVALLRARRERRSAYVPAIAEYRSDEGVGVNPIEPSVAVLAPASGPADPDETKDDEAHEDDKRPVFEGILEPARANGRRTAMVAASIVSLAVTGLLERRRRDR